MSTVRTERRISIITGDGDETLTLCEIPCRDEYLQGLGVSGQNTMARYRSRGQADITVAWSGLSYHIEWRRGGRPSAKFCDLCGDEWRTVIPALVTRHAEQAREGRLKWERLSEAEQEAVRARLRRTAIQSPSPNPRRGP